MPPRTTMRRDSVIGSPARRSANGETAHRRLRSPAGGGDPRAQAQAQAPAAPQGGAGGGVQRYAQAHAPPGKATPGQAAGDDRPPADAARQLEPDGRSALEDGEPGAHARGAL